MGAYINKRMISNFMSLTRGIIEGDAICFRCTNHKFKETESHHRSIRILAKRGYLEAKNIGSHTDYYITPKGLALYDSVLISLEQL